MPIATRYPAGLGTWKPHVQRAVKEIADKFNISTVGTYPGHGSAGDGGISLSADFMTGSKSKHDAILAYGKANAKRLGIKYIISWRRIWSVQRSSEGNRHYSGSSNPHIDHVHITFLSSAAGGAIIDTGSSSQSETFTPAPSALDNLIDAVKAFNAFAGWIGNPHNWLRLLYIILGLIILLISISRSGGSDAANQIQKAGKSVASLAKS